MKIGVIVAVLFLVVSASAGERQAIEISVGGGLWIPTGIEFNSNFTAGPGFTAGLQIPMDLGNVIYLRTGYLTAGTNVEGYDGIACIPITIGYRTFPLYRRFAGPRALELFAGVYAGGLLAWDRVQEGDKTNTGGGMGGIELGTRIYAGESTFFDISLCFDYAGIGTALIGEDDLSGFKITGMLSFAP